MNITVIKRAQHGDAEALSCLSAHATSMATTYVYRLTLDYHLAQDLCQETMLRLLHHLPHLRIEQPDDLWSWIRRTALSRVQDNYRRSTRRQRRHEETIQRHDQGPSTNSGPPEALVRRELAQAIWRAMSKLALHYRNILTLRCLDGLSYAQVAQVTGQTQLQARLLFFRARRSLKHQLRKQGVQQSDLVGALGVFAGVTWTGGKAETATAGITTASVKVGFATALLGTAAGKAGIVVIGAAAAGLIGVGVVQSHLTSQIKRAGPVGLPEATVKRIDNTVMAYLNQYDFVNVAVVDDANIVLTSAYGRAANLRRPVPYAGATPFVATIALKLYEQGVIRSLDDPIQQYSAAFSYYMPSRYADSPLTFRHLLAHTSGIVARPGKDGQPVWSNDHLNLKFRPGTDVWLSDSNYALLETVLAEITGKDLDRLLDEYIETPVQAASFAALEPSDPAVAGVECTVEDAARFVSGLLAGRYISQELLVQEMWRPQRINYGLGWFLLIPDESPGKGHVIGMFHYAHSNDRHECMIYICRGPGSDTSAAIVLGRRARSTAPWLGPRFQLPVDLATIIGQM